VGIQGAKATAVALDPRFREGDDILLLMLVSFRAGLLDQIGSAFALMMIFSTGDADA
jgi:hypothetical protein